jgi:hypothetical protein
MEKNGLAVPKARTEHLVTRDMPDEVLIYDLKSHKAHCLNHTAATVWQYCDGQTSVPEIAARLRDNHDAVADESLVWLAVKQLGKADLLQERIALPAPNGRLGRRAALRNLGLGVALAVPVVMTVIAPTAVMAATCAGVGAPCTKASPTNCCMGCCDGPSLTGTCDALKTAPGFPCSGNGNCCSNDCSGNPKICIGLG